MHRQLLDFWLREIDPEQWRTRDPAFDELLTDRFTLLLDQAAQGELSSWRQTAHGRLAEVIVLDQFSRNIHRGSPRAFRQDPMALALAQEAVSAGALEHLESMERVFLLMPYMHSESALIHRDAERLFKHWTSERFHGFELRHKIIIDRFGRYPHRNRIVGRISTPEEEAFLLEPGSSF